MWMYGQTGEDGQASRSDLRTQEKLDRALVAGLILEVVLDQPNVPNSCKARQRLVKSRIQDYLVQHLAGRVSLDRFRALAQNLDGWFDYYYPLLAADGRPGAPQTPGPVTYAVREPQAGYNLKAPDSEALGAEAAPEPPRPVHHACLDELLDNWLAEAGSDIPHRSHRKLTPAKLRKFLRLSGGRWFRLRDFERFVQMDRKTAWDYLQQFLQTGLLCHNRKNSAAVRYCLAPVFLKVEADALRLAVSLTLSHYAEDLTEKTSDFLIASGGEPFAPWEWRQEFPDPHGSRVLEELASKDILVWQELPTGSRFVRLHHRWLRQEAQTSPEAPRGVLVYQTASP